MLDACHDRVRRSLDLLRRLRDYLRGHGHGCDDSARQAARDVLPTSTSPRRCTMRTRAACLSAAAGPGA